MNPKVKRAMWFALDVTFHAGIVLCVMLISGWSWAADTWKTLRERRDAEYH